MCDPACYRNTSTHLHKTYCYYNNYCYRYADGVVELSHQQRNNGAGQEQQNEGIPKLETPDVESLSAGKRYVKGPGSPVQSTSSTVAPVRTPRTRCSRDTASATSLLLTIFPTLRRIAACARIAESRNFGEASQSWEHLCIRRRNEQLSNVGKSDEETRRGSN